MTKICGVIDSFDCIHGCDFYGKIRGCLIQWNIEQDKQWKMNTKQISEFKINKSYEELKGNLKRF